MADGRHYEIVKCHLCSRLIDLDKIWYDNVY